jgi:hypothetical protein
VVAAVVVMIDERRDLPFEITWQEVVFQQDAVLQSLVPSLIFGIRFEYPAQMRLAQDNNVVHTLTSDRSDQPFGKMKRVRWACPGCPWRAIGG